MLAVSQTEWGLESWLLAWSCQGGFQGCCGGREERAMTPLFPYFYEGVRSHAWPLKNKTTTKKNTQC